MIILGNVVLIFGSKEEKDKFFKRKLRKNGNLKKP